MRSLLVIVLICYACLSAIGAAAETFPATNSSIEGKELVLGIRSKEDSWGKLHIAIYTEAFRRIGVNVKFKSFPLKRLSYLIDRSNFLDGDVSRVHSYNETHCNLIRVEEAHSISEIRAYSDDAQLKLDGWDSLSDSQLRVDYRHGSKKTFEMLHLRVPEERMHHIHSIKAGFQRILLGRSDIFILSGAAAHVQDGLFEGKRIYMSGVMEKTTFHAFLLKKHEKVAIKLARALKQMKEEGLINKFRNDLGLPKIDWRS